MKHETCETASGADPRVVPPTRRPRAAAQFSQLLWDSMRTCAARRAALATLFLGLTGPAAAASRSPLREKIDTELRGHCDAEGQNCELELCDVTDELIDASEELTAKEKAQAKILVTKACGDAPHAVLQAVLGLFTVMTGVSELLKTFFPDQHTELRGAAMGQWVGVGGAARCSAFAAAIVAIMYMGACKPVFNALGMEQQVKMCAPLQDFGGWTGRALQSIYAFGATVVANASGRGRSAFAATGLLYAAMTAVPAAVKALVAGVWASFPDGGALGVFFLGFCAAGGLFELGKKY